MWRSAYQYSQTTFQRDRKSMTQDKRHTTKIELNFFQYWAKLSDWERELIQYACKTYNADIKDVVFRLGGI